MGLVQIEEPTKTAEMVVRYDTTTEELKAYSQRKCDRTCADCCSGNPVFLKDDVNRLVQSGKFSEEDLSRLLTKTQTPWGQEVYVPNKVDGACIFLDKDYDQGEERYGCDLQEVKPIGCATYSCEIKSSTIAWFYYNYLGLKELIANHDMPSLIKLEEILSQSTKHDRLMLPKEEFEALDDFAGLFFNVSNMFASE